jgi:dynein assembly factor with WDR repeat domains 1
MQTLRGHKDEVLDIAFNSTGTLYLFILLGTRLVTASADSTARVYNVHTGECISDLKGHSGEISKVSFNPSGNQIITGSADCTAKILYV